MTRPFLLVGLLIFAGATSCKKSEPEPTQTPASPQTEAPVATQAPVAQPSAAPTQTQAVEEPAGIPVPADFEPSAEQTISKANLEQELDKVEKELEQP